MNLLDGLHAASSTWGSWVIHASWQAALFGVVILGLARLFRHEGASLRYALLMLAMVKFATPPFIHSPTGLLQHLEPVVARSAIDQRLRSLAITSNGEGELDASIPAAMEGGAIPASTDSFAPREPQSFPWLRLLFAVHMAGAIGVLVWLGMQLVAIHGVVKRGKQLDGGHAFDEATGLARELGLRGQPRLLSTTYLRRPIAFGILRPTIALPDALLRQLSGDRLRAVIAHELIHLRHRDPLSNALVALLGAVWWFHPLYWFVAIRLRDVQEEWCDNDLLLREITSRSTYCQTLLDVMKLASSRRSLTPWVAPMASHGGSLDQRFRRILNPTSVPELEIRMFHRLLLATLALCFLPGIAAGIPQPTPTPASPPAAQPNAAAAPESTPPAGGAVEKGLQWLASIQSADGAFQLSTNDAARSPQSSAATLHDTALATLAFLGAGITSTSGPHADTVKSGLGYLAAHAHTGEPGAQSSEERRAGAVAAVGLLEGYGLSGSHDLLAPANNAIAYCVLLAGDSAFGKELDATYWTMLAMAAARDFHVEFDRDVYAEATRTARSIRSEKPGERAAIALTRLFQGEPLAQTPELSEAANVLLEDVRAGHNLSDLSLLHGSQLLYQIGGSGWHDWNRLALPKVAQHQRSDGSWTASSSSDSFQQEPSVRVTAIRLLTLEVHYRYARITASR